MKTSFLARGGLLSALSCIFIYISTILPINKIFLLIISSCFVPIGILSSGLKVGVFIYLTSSLLSLFLIGIKSTVILYIMFFGLYGIVKLYIEKLRKLPLEIILKFSFFNICLLFSLYMYTKFFFDITSFKSTIPIPLILLGFQVVFVLYDYALTVFIHEINKKFF